MAREQILSKIEENESAIRAAERSISRFTAPARVTAAST
jgi:hypothetical protein